ncbi:hypothetical protein PFLmoz3_02879 [Pseudomonas fluorescens]|uniref:Uncharacterized protein n=1 Tax=Pseudomonas fluorescens TaxID=294 RepID=A0A109LGB7_PSEFL|nr:hypothetical protein PFLmoz3_02879 [Pseudomonas fluorescens]
MAQLLEVVTPRALRLRNCWPTVSSPARPVIWLRLTPLSLSASASGTGSSGALGVSQASLSTPTFCASTRDESSSCKLLDWLKLSRQNSSAESSGFQYSGL